MSKSLKARLAALVASGVEVDDDEELNSRLSGDDNSEEESEVEIEDEGSESIDTPDGDPEPEVNKTESNSSPDIDRVIALSSKVGKLESDVERLEKELASRKESEELAKEGLKLSSERLAIGLGITIAGLDNMSLSALCEQFQTLNSSFVKTFNVSRTTGMPKASKGETESTQTNSTVALIKSTKPRNK